MEALITEANHTHDKKLAMKKRDVLTSKWLRQDYQNPSGDEDNLAVT